MIRVVKVVASLALCTATVLYGVCFAGAPYQLRPFARSVHTPVVPRTPWLTRYNCTDAFISVRGLAAHLADVMPTQIRADTSHFTEAEYAGVGNGSFVFVVTSSLGRFVHLMRNRTVRFYLMTGAGVLGSPMEVSATLGVDWRAFLQTHVIRWYTQNHDLGYDSHPLVHAVPLGIDFHTLAEAQVTGHPWGARQTECAQAAQLRDVADAAPELDGRDATVYVPRMALMHRYGNDRRRAYAKVRRGEPYLTFQSTPLSRTELWRQMARHRFVLSPLGMGMDCHRTWEALALGSIPIVRRSPLVSSLFRDVSSIVVVDDWTDVNRTSVAAWTSAFRHMRRRDVQWYARLDTWLDRLRASSNK